MRLSTQGRYAVRAMVDVALHAGESAVPRAEIARRQGISAAYIAQLFRKLERAGLVQGVKGPTGGYRLARPPAQITVGDIVRAAEGPIALVHCVPPDGEARCRRAECCVTRRLWQTGVGRHRGCAGRSDPAGPLRAGSAGGRQWAESTATSPKPSARPLWSV